jgi:hypothetical protein
VIASSGRERADRETALPHNGEFAINCFPVSRPDTDSFVFPSKDRSVVIFGRIASRASAYRTVPYARNWKQAVAFSDGKGSTPKRCSAWQNGKKLAIVGDADPQRGSEPKTSSASQIGRSN